MENFEKIASLLSEQLNIAKDKIKPDSSVIEDLGADSLDVVEMLMGLEEEFGITVSEEEASNIKTVGDIVALIDKSGK